MRLLFWLRDYLEFGQLLLYRAYFPTCSFALFYRFDIYCICGREIEKLFANTYRTTRKFGGRPTTTGKILPPSPGFCSLLIFSFPFPLAGHPPSLSTSPSYSLHIPSYRHPSICRFSALAHFVGYPNLIRLACNLEIKSHCCRNIPRPLLFTMGISPRRSGRSTATATTTTTTSSSLHTTSPPSPRRRRNSLQSYNQSPPPPAPAPAQPAPQADLDSAMTSPPPEADDAEDEDDDASAEITRCVCGSQEYPFPDADIEDAGFMICCERCNVWQHGPCVGVMSEKEAPDTYYCEECRPDLHELGNRNQG